MERVSVYLQPAREKSVLHGHPWIFSGSIARVTGNSGDNSPALADVLDSRGCWLAQGIWNPQTNLAVRLYSWDEKRSIDADFLCERIGRAVAMRENMANAMGTTDSTTNAYRLVFSESDGLSGLIVDRYADTLVVQVSAGGLVPHLGPIVAYLTERTNIKTILVKADPESANREGFDPASIATLSTQTRTSVGIRENGLLFEVDLESGQKTGFFLDQRDNRSRVALHAAGRHVLSAYCYTGAFETYAARAGAREILGLDSSEPALTLARHHQAINGFATPATYEKADVPLALRKFRDEARTFDMIILDPPRFVASTAQKERGMRAYKDINLLAMKLLSQEGILATFSCSGMISSEEFSRIIGWASVDARRRVRVVETLGQPFDHPILATFQESNYLNGLICLVE